ncbi:hypothetical protein VS877_22645, partial [Salmonella enterica subsp. enterica serovar Paratyphi A]|nr:hypothetical protein [Salmonella enterica subsp. enterica serovar Paratyphi A]
HTVTFIALKPGLLTGKARDVTGILHYDALGLEGWLASHTVTFIALKPGLLTGKARDVTGILHYDALGLEG